MVASADDITLQDRAQCPWLPGRCLHQAINPEPHDVDKCLACLVSELIRELQIKRGAL